MQQSIESDREHTHRAQKTHRRLTAHSRHTHDHTTLRHTRPSRHAHTRAPRGRTDNATAFTHVTLTRHTHVPLHSIHSQPQSGPCPRHVSIKQTQTRAHSHLTSARPRGLAQQHRCTPPPPQLSPPTRPSPRPRPPSQAGMRPQHSTAVVSLILHCDWQWPGPLRYKRRRMVCSVRRGRVAACTPLRLQVMPAP